MTTVEEAKQIIKDYAPLLPVEMLKTQEALGRILAAEMHSPFALPSFRQSAMDGYAVQWHNNRQSFRLIGEISAGKSEPIEVAAAEAVRIFTGARVPDSADTVIMQEWVEPMGSDQIQIKQGKSPKKGQHIRPIGEQLNKGELALPKGLKLNGAALGLIQSFGLDKVAVYKLPIVHLLLTGDELVTPGEALEEGEIYESNGISISSVLKTYGYKVQQQEWIEDKLESTVDALAKALSVADVVISSGGISVGDHDHIAEALERNGVVKHFYGVKQKPGKPLYFGSKGQCSVFALPGNPASALSCLYEYLIPHLNIRCGSKEEQDALLEFPLAHNFISKGDRAVFYKARLKNGSVKILDRQASSMLQSFALANCIAFVPGHKTELSKGELIKLRLIS